MKASNSTQKAHYYKSKQRSHYDALENKVSNTAAEAFRRPAYPPIGAAEYIKRKAGKGNEQRTGG